MNRAYREKERTPFNYKFKSFDTVRESMNYQIIHCQDCQESNKSGSVKELNKDDLVILKYGDENMIAVFGVIEEIEKTPLSDEEGSDSFCMIMVHFIVHSFVFSINFYACFSTGFRFMFSIADLFSLCTPFHGNTKFLLTVIILKVC